MVDTRVFETYPVLAMIALGWTLPDARRATGRLPKYNPERRRTFSIPDWQHVCERASEAYQRLGLTDIAKWIDEAFGKPKPVKSDQDCLDAYICLLVAINFSRQEECLMVGEQGSGYMIVPYCPGLHAELEIRCYKTARVPSR